MSGIAPFKSLTPWSPSAVDKATVRSTMVMERRGRQGLYWAAATSAVLWRVLSST